VKKYHHNFIECKLEIEGRIYRRSDSGFKMWLLDITRYNLSNKIGIIILIISKMIRKKDTFVN